LNPVDVVFGVLLLLALVRGYSRGLLGTAATYVAPVVAFVVAAEWSDPVRDRLAEVMPAADFVLDILAPFIVFVVVVIVIRAVAALLARLLGVGRSLPSRIVAAAASVAVSAIVLGAIVLLTREMSPAGRPRIDDTGAGAVIADPVERAIADLDRRFSESLLAPPMAALASQVVHEAVAHQQLLDRERLEDAARKAAAVAGDAARRLPAAGALPRRDREEPAAPAGDAPAERRK